jgi:predicted mannosyl-3-phosphoglycerate phosphatase (HAD superfamily)
MSILCIDLHSSKGTIRLAFHFQNVTYESLDDIYCSKFRTGCNPQRAWMTALREYYTVGIAKWFFHENS